MAGKNNLRKKSVVDSQIQWTLAMRVVLHFFIFVCAGAVFGIINQFLADPFGGVQKNLLAFVTHSGPFLLALVCLMPIFIRDTLTLTNRMAGPIYNLRRTVQQLADGEANVRPLKFRDGDFWPDLPDAFNAMTERLQNGADASREQVSEPALQEERSLVEV